MQAMHIGGKHQLPKNRPLQRTHPITDEAEMFRMHSFSQDENR